MYVTDGYQLLVAFVPYRPIKTITLTLPTDLRTMGGFGVPVQSSHIQVSLLIDGSPVVCGVSCEQK